ncbi:MAG: elongation factor 1-beta [Candidatus Woesearchaeota archaeon]
MAKVVATIRVMPESPTVDLAILQKIVEEKITEFAGSAEKKFEQKPIAFGLKALDVTFIMDEDLGSTDALEQTLKTIEHVQDVQTTDVRRALG